MDGIRRDGAALEVIDLSLDQREARSETRRRFWRVIAPFPAAALPIGATLGAITVVHVTSRNDALRPADGVLEALEQRIATEARGWLGPAGRVAMLLREIEKSGVFRQDIMLAEPIGAALLNSVPQIASVDVGSMRGDLIMLRRNAESGLDARAITSRPQRSVVNAVRGPDGRVLRGTPDPDDACDPRSRPWFQGAPATDELYRTSIYVFFTDPVPGLTVSLACQDRRGPVRGVFGVDVRLDTLSALLARLDIGKGGRAMIIDGTGQLVAFPGLERPVRQGDGTLLPVRLDALGEPVLVRGFDVFRLEGPGRHRIEVAGVRHLTIAHALGARRVSLWRLGSAGRPLRCEGVSEARTGLLVAGARIAREQIPDAFTAMPAGPLDVTDTAPDPRLVARHRDALPGADTRSLMAVPIRHGTGPIGLLWVEDRAVEAGGADAFARAAAAMPALRFQRQAAPGRRVEEIARLAVGLDGGRARAGAVAAAALALQERPAEQFRAAEQPLGLRIGIDTGIVIGSAVGGEARSCNIRGAAMRCATVMAASAPEAGIRVTESTRALIGEGFRARSRGRFWLGGTGEMATFLLSAGV